jgi:hypothetical protein
VWQRPAAAGGWWRLEMENEGRGGAAVASWGRSRPMRFFSQLTTHNSTHSNVTRYSQSSDPKKGTSRSFPGYVHTRESVGGFDIFMNRLTERKRIIWQEVIHMNCFLAKKERMESSNTEATYIGTLL